jgi:hypothetical protein
MTTTNVYFTHGIKNEQYLVEDLIIESLRMYGNEVMYIPRTLISKDNILGEDRLSQFKTAFPIEMYFENIDSFAGQGFMIQKFGLMIEQSATLVVARRRWEQFVGRYGVTTVPSRPNEGDLIYFPLSKGLFEIKFVQHQDPFYQLGKLYVYKLQVELFQYASERIDTGHDDIDAFESLKTFSTDITDSKYGEVTAINITNNGSGYSNATVNFISSIGYGATAEAVIGTGGNAGKIINIIITNPGAGYKTIPYVSIIGNGNGAVIEAEVNVNIDKVDSYGDNNTLQEIGSSFILNNNNIFGDPL